MKTDQRHVARRQSGLFQQRLDCPGMGLGQDLFRRRRWTPAPAHPRRRSRAVIQRRAQQRAGVGVIRQRQAGAGTHDLFAIGFQQCGIDAVQRGAAHQADDFLDVRPLCYCPHVFCTEFIACRPRRNSSPNFFAPSWRAGPITTARSRGRNWTRLFAKERVTAYIGFDCTATSMHVGNLVQLMTLRRLQQAGHRPILLMGGGTTKAGDPSGKDETRLILTPEQIEANKQQHGRAACSTC